MVISTIGLPIKAELKEVDDLLAEKTAADVELVTTVTQHVLQDGGKRIRPALLLLAAKMLGFTGREAICMGAAIEMIHAASLLHDDVLDNATIRRGKPSANVKWGNQVSILVGDFLWCRASEIAIANGNNRILSTITDATKKTTEGEILEIVKGNDFNVSSEEYLKIITFKTATLFSCSCHIGAILARAPDRFETALKNFGLGLGVAFQLTDDVLDYTANEEKFGKRAGTDLSEGKLTLPVILAFQKCATEEISIIKEALLANTMDARKLIEIREILNRYGTLKESIIMAKRYAEEAKRELSIFKHSIERESLEALADYAISRSE